MHITKLLFPTDTSLLWTWPFSTGNSSCRNLLKFVVKNTLLNQPVSLPFSQCIDSLSLLQPAGIHMWILTCVSAYKEVATVQNVFTSEKKRKWNLLLLQPEQFIFITEKPVAIKQFASYTEPHNITCYYKEINYLTKHFHLLHYLFSFCFGEGVKQVLF